MSTNPKPKPEYTNQPPIIDGIRVVHRFTEDDGSVAFSDLPRSVSSGSTPVVELMINGGPLNGGSVVILDDSWLANHLVTTLIETFWKVR